MKVYEVKFDSEKFQHLQLEQSASGLIFEAAPCEEWKTPGVQAVNCHLAEPDIWSIGIDSGAFAVNAKAMDLLAMFLEMAGELLPLTYEAELTLCNVLVCTDCADADASEWQLDADGNRLQMLKPVFYENSLPGMTLFKIPQLARRIYFCETSEDPEEEFRACVLENVLKGVDFELIWEVQNPS